MWYLYGYHIWYHIWCHGPASMISRTYDIIGQWYQNTQIWYHTWFSVCVYPPPKTRLEERCRSRSWQHQAQQVQNQRRWSVVLLDKAQLGCCVWRLQTRTGNAQYRASESQSVLRRRRPLQAPPVLVVILHLHLRWTHRRCSAGDPCAGAGRGGGAAGSSRPQRRSHPCWSSKPWTPCRWSRWASQGLLFPSWSGTGRLQEITTQLGSLHAGSIPAHNLYNNIGRTSNRLNITAGLPAGEWNREMGLKVKMCMQFCVPRNSKNFCWIGCHVTCRPLNE